MSDQTRQPSGVPVGGQFAASARTEPEIALTPPAIGGLGIAAGDALYLTPSEAGTDIFIGGLEIIHDDDGGYRVQGAIPLDMVDGYLEMTGQGEANTLDPDSPRFAEAVAWLDDHRQVIDSFLQDRYGMEFDNSCDEWSFQRAQFTVELDPAVDTLDTVAARLENESKAIQMYNEMDAGTYGSPYLWSEAKLHMAAWDNEVKHAERGYLTDLMEDSGIPYATAEGRVENLGDDELEKSAGHIRVFMRENHDLITQAKRTHQEQHGHPYHPGTLGRDISLALNNPPGTPHGRMAFGSLPSELHQRLAARARNYTAQPAA